LEKRQIIEGLASRNQFAGAKGRPKGDYKLKGLRETKLEREKMETDKNKQQTTGQGGGGQQGGGQGGGQQGRPTRRTLTELLEQGGSRLFPPSLSTLSDQRGVLI